MAPLTVACVNVGNYLDRGEEYVETLRSMAARHLPDHEFVCITESAHAGWWCKLELFRPGRFDGPVVYFDLDVVIHRDVSGLLALLDAGNFWALDDFAWPLSRAADLEWLERIGQLPRELPDMKPLLGGWGTCNSSVMLWRGDAGADIWNRYSPEAAEGLHGDQNWITRVMGHRLKLIPPGWAGSYRYGPPGCPITVYHGSPKPHEVDDRDWC